MKSLRLLLVVPVLAIVLAGCSSKPTVTTETESTPAVIEDTSADDVMMKDESTNSAAESDASMMKEDADFTVEMSNFKFSVAEMKVKAGQEVTVKVVNKEGTHDFIVDGIADAKTAQMTGAKEETITFTVPASAKGKTLEYYCSVGKHRTMGMVGKLIVE